MTLYVVVKLKGFILKLIKPVLALSMILCLQGCISYDLVYVETHTTGKIPKRGTAVKEVKYKGGFKWVGLIISPIAPFPIMFPYGREHTTTWTSRTEGIVYKERQYTKSKGYGCFFLGPKISGCSDEATWGTFFINDLKLH